MRLTELEKESWGLEGAQENIGDTFREQNLRSSPSNQTSRNCVRPISEFMDLRRSSELAVRTFVSFIAFSQSHWLLPSLAISFESLCSFFFCSELLGHLAFDPRLGS